MQGNPFNVDHLRTDVGRRATHAGALVIAGEGAKFLVSLASTAVLARMLAPEAFGLLAMVWALAGLAALFTDLGLSMATVQRRELTEAQVSCLFWINAAAGSALALAVAALAPAVAWFYGEPRLSGMTVALASAFLLAGLAVQHRALLQRQMRFRALVAIDLVAALGGVAVAVVCAALGYGYWSLVANVLAAAALTTALSWALCGWLPGLPSSKAADLWSLLSFGGHFTGFTMLNYFARNLDKVLIGWWWGAAELALYDRAYKLLLLPVDKINRPVWRVMAPALSQIHHEGALWARAYRRSAMAVMLVGAPLSAFCFVFADVIIEIVLGGQWTGAVEVFRYLAISGMAQCLGNTVGWTYVSSGRTDRMLRWGVISSSAVCLSFLVGLPFGPAGVALAYSLTVTALTIPSLVYACRTIPLRPGQILSAALPPIAASVAAGACAYGTRILAGPSAADGLVPALGVFLLTYLFFVLPWQGPRETIAFAVQKLAAAR